MCLRPALRLLASAAPVTPRPAVQFQPHLAEPCCSSILTDPKKTDTQTGQNDPACASRREGDVCVCPQRLAAVGLRLGTGTLACIESLGKLFPGVMCGILFLPCDLCGDEIRQPWGALCLSYS